MERYVPFALDETYHVYSRGVNKQDIFTSDWDRERFQALLLLCNSTHPAHLGNLLTKYKGGSFIKLFEKEGPEERIVEVLAYCLMPNHIHLVLYETTEGGISKFMGKLMTAYAMYFNKKYERSGPLFTRPFRARHVDSDEYFREIFAYVHLNPVSLIEPKWKEEGVKDMESVRKFVENYRWCSFYDYSVGERPERSIIAYLSERLERVGDNENVADNNNKGDDKSGGNGNSANHIPDFLKEQNDLDGLLEWSGEYEI